MRSKAACGTLIIIIWEIITTTVHAQNKISKEDSVYTRVIHERADKIVKTLSISSGDKAERVRNIIVNQYRNLNTLHDRYAVKTKATAQQREHEKEKTKTELENKLNASLDSLHSIYMAQLGTELNPEQIDQVKDGMTYGILPITYKGYQEMIPELTSEQKKQILIYLTEAREHAMDAGSSEKKHWWFGKYKGRINNYLSAAGYDLKKAGEEWDKRRKESGKS